MTRLGFAFDTNKCTGCNACQIACIIENQLDFSTHWRQVVTFNEHHHPEIPVFHLSMACNHCVDPPCMKYCPALAYFKDVKYETVQIDTKKCIGCKYCSWVCPYDAPEYQKNTGVVTKCTLCQTRLEENLNPACVALCPTDALQLSEFYKPHNQGKVPGFTPSNIRPSIKITPLHSGQEIPEKDFFPFNLSVLEKFKESQKSIKNKTSLKSEWTLLLFTIMVPLLIAFYTHSRINSINSAPIVLISAGFLGIIISSLHLGKKFRAYRIVFNWRHSWLSREIVSYSSFIGLVILAELVFTETIILGWAAIVAGIMTLISIDMVYVIIPREKNSKLHSAQVIFSGFLYFSIFSDYNILFIIIILVKFYLFLHRRIPEQKVFSTLSLLRIVCGFILPLLLLIFSYSLQSHLVWALILFAETTDRISFYHELDIITPAKQVKRDYLDWLSASDVSRVSITE